MIISSHKITNKEQVTQDYLDKLTIVNPAYSGAQRLGFSTRGIPEHLPLYFEQDGKVYIPRNYPINPSGTDEIIDKRVSGTKVHFDIKLTLREKQIPAVNALIGTNDGILVAPCGTGKTIMGSYGMAKVGVTTLILVHKELLIGQWRDAIQQVTGEEPGIIQGSTWNWKGKKVVIAMLQTLYAQKDRIPMDFINYFGLIISDEVHRVSAPTWSQIIALFPAKRRWGLTATPKRYDHLEIIFHYHLGKIIYEITGTELTPLVYMVRTKTAVPTREYTRGGRINTAKLITGLTLIDDRNKKILRHLVDAAKANRKIILLTDRVFHAKYLKECFDDYMKDSEVTTSLYIGSITDINERKEAEKADVIFATTQIAKEALNIPELDTLFLASPSSSQITVQQAAGRILRATPDKQFPMVIDFVDDNVTCRHMADARVRIYRTLKYPIKVV